MRAIGTNDPRIFKGRKPDSCTSDKHVRTQAGAFTFYSTAERVGPTFNFLAIYRILGPWSLCRFSHDWIHDISTHKVPVIAKITSIHSIVYMHYSGERRYPKR